MSENPNIDLVYGQSFLLHKRKVAVQEAVSGHLRRTAVRETTEEEIFDRLLHRLTAYVLEEEVVRRVQEFKTKASVTVRTSVTAKATVDVPRTWFQHLKQDHFPKWWLKRWPARMRHVSVSRRKYASKTGHNTVTHTADFSQYAQFPTAQIKTPEKYRGAAIVFREELNTPEWNEDTNDS